MHNLARKFIREGSIYSLQPILQKIIGFLLIPVYTTHLTTADYGNLQYVMVFGSLCMAVTDLGLGTSFWKFRSKGEKWPPGEVALNIFILQMFIGLVVLALAFMLKIAFFKPSLLAGLILLQLLTCAVYTVLINIQLILRADHRVAVYVLMSVGHTLLLIVLNIYLVAGLKLNYAGVVYGNLIASGIAGVAFAYVLIREFRGGWRWPLSVEMLRYGYPVMLANLAAFSMTFADRFFLKHFSTEAELGLYSFGYKFADLIMALLITPFFLTWNPIRWEIYAMENAKYLFAKFNRMLLILLPVLAMLVMAAAVLMGTVMTVNKEYLAGFGVLGLLGFSHVFYAFYYFNQMGMLFRNRTKTIMLVIVVCSALNLALNWLLIPGFGMRGASLATLISYFCMFVSGGLLSQRFYPIERKWRFEMVQITLVLVYCAVLTWMGLYAGLPALIWSCGILAVFHLGFNYAFGAEFRADIVKILNRGFRDA